MGRKATITKKPMHPNSPKVMFTKYVGTIDSIFPAQHRPRKRRMSRKSPSGLRTYQPPNHKLIKNQIIFRVSKRVDKCEVTRGAKKLNPSTEQRLSERHLPTSTGGRLLPTPPQQPSGITQCGALLMGPIQIQEAASQTCWDQSETKSSGELAFRDASLAGLGHSATQGSHTEEGANVPPAP